MGSSNKKEKDLERVNNLFDAILYLIYTNTTERKDFLKTRFAWSLSSSKRSNNLLESILAEIPKKEYLDVMQKFEGV